MVFASNYRVGQLSCQNSYWLSQHKPPHLAKCIATQPYGTILLVLTCMYVTRSGVINLDTAFVPPPQEVCSDPPVPPQEVAIVQISPLTPDTLSTTYD